MQELVQQVLSQIRSALRFRWQGMALAWAVCLLGWVWAASQPDVYEASARVFVDTSSVLEPLLRDQIVATDVESQLAYVREALLGQEQLESVAREVGLDANARTEAARAAVLSSLQQNIRIDSVPRMRNRADQVYSISYRNTDRQRAIDVVRVLLNTFVEDALGEKRRGGDTAEQFLDARVREYEQRLARAEQALADFKREHAERLPGQEGGYFDRMQAERDALATARRDLRILLAQKEQLEKQLQGQAAVVDSTQPGNQQLAPNSLDARIRDTRVQLDTLLLEYTERHPDVIALREQLDTLLEQRKEQLSALGVEGTDRELANLDANPVYQELQIALNETEVDIATLRTDIAEREQEVEHLQSLIDDVPQVEAQLARLNRDYDVVYQQYQDLVRSRETQELTRKASDSDQTDFRVIDPPGAAFAPVAPPRLLLLGGVLGAGIGAGGGVAYLLSLLWPVYSSAWSLRHSVQLPVLGAVSHAWRDRRRSEIRGATIGYAIVLAALVAVFGALVAVELTGPGVHELVGRVVGA